MKLLELETPDVRRDPQAALARAIDDVPSLEEAHERAEDRVAKGEAERQRLLQKFRNINTEVRSTTDKLIAAKKKWLASAIEDGEDAAAHKEYLRARDRKRGLTDQLSWIANFSQEDCAREILEASIAEREAMASLLEARAVRQRLGMIANAASAATFDPGVSLQFDDSWSGKVAKDANDIRAIAVKGLTEELARHDSAVAARRDLIFGKLFS